MPPRQRRHNRPNGKWLDILEALRESHRDDQNRNTYLSYCKAINGLRADENVYDTADKLLSVNGIGTTILQKIKTYNAGNTLDSKNSEPVTKPTPRPRGGALKRSATEVDLPPPTRPVKRVASDVLPQLASEERQGEFKFWYIDTENKPVRNRAQARVSLSDNPAEPFLLFRVAYPASQAHHPLVQKLSNRSKFGKHWAGDIPEPSAEPYSQCPGFDGFPDGLQAASRTLSALLEAENKTKSRSQNTLDPSRQLPSRYSQGNGSASSSKAAVKTPSEAPSGPSLSQPQQPSRTIKRAATGIMDPPIPQIQRTHSLPISAAPTNRARLSHAIPVPAAVEHASIYLPQTTFPEFTPIVLPARSYTVQMILDNREQAGGSRQSLREKLLNKGLQSINLEALQLGDVTWVAKVGNQRYVLDVVLERKRLDDLIGSIKDGRFHEQKFRLQQSAISRVFYLVEEYNAEQNKEVWGPQINTALSSTQAVDGFLVKETKSMDETMSYLVGLTRQITEDHQVKDLYVIPTAMIKRHSYCDLQAYLKRRHPDRTYITSFEDFQWLNSKSGFLTVQDTWARMLLCVRGMSAEKAAAVLNEWRTPREFWEALKAAEKEEESARYQEEMDGGGRGKGKGKNKSCVPTARMMLKGVGGAEGGTRAIGPKLSSDVYDLFRKQNFDEDA